MGRVNVETHNCQSAQSESGHLCHPHSQGWQDTVGDVEEGRNAVLSISSSKEMRQQLISGQKMSTDAPERGQCRRLASELSLSERGPFEVNR